MVLSGEKGGRRLLAFAWIFGSISLLAATAVLTACVAWESVSYSFRITLGAEADGVLKTASNVYRVTIRRFLAPDGWKLDIQVEGDAIFLNLGQGHNLLMLIGRGTSGWSWLFSVLPRDVFRPSLRRNEMHEFREVAAVKGKAELRERTLPLLAVMEDVSDPKTLRIIDPSELPRIYGDKVQFRGATIEMTNDRVTRGVAKALPWLSTMEPYERPPRTVAGSGGQITLSPRLFTRSWNDE